MRAVPAASRWVSSASTQPIVPCSHGRLRPSLRRAARTRRFRAHRGRAAGRRDGAAICSPPWSSRRAPAWPPSTASTRRRTRAIAPGDEVALVPPVSGGGGRRAARPRDRRPARRGRRRGRGARPGRGRRGALRGRHARRSTSSTTRPTWRWPSRSWRPSPRRRPRGTGCARWPSSTAPGTVPLSEPSVLVAVSAPHRGEAFAGARAVIDRVKAEAPIWKVEVTAAGRHARRGHVAAHVVPMQDSAAWRAELSWGRRRGRSA